MKQTPCLYAIIRFCPYVETEEFANVGVILLAPQKRYFGYKLMTKRHARITNFFDDIDSAVYKSAMQNLKGEFERIAEMLDDRWHGSYDNDAASIAKKVLEEITRPRESVIKFGGTRVVLADKPKEKLDQLCGYYVDRDFITKEYRETILEKTMRRWITDAGLSGKFERMEIGNDEYHATFPFVEQSGSDLIKVVKPLNLAHEQPNKILDHGGQWLFRLETLKRKGLMPTKTLFAVEGPGGQDARGRAYTEIVGALSETGVTVLPYSEKKEIMRFVAEPF